MLGPESYFYNKSLKKIVAVFGTIFNDIFVSKSINGKAQGITRVPLSYAPKAKYLARLSSLESGANVAIKMPRMSFEITSISYDSTAKLNRLNTYLHNTPDGENPSRIYQSVPYIIGLQLNILARHQDDALQILEQILPYFSPDYTVSVKDLEGPDTVSDLPITLSGVSMQDDYEGDLTARRTIIYTLDFNMKVKFGGPFANRAKIIKTVDANLYSSLDALSPDMRIRVELEDKENDTPEDYTVITTYGFADPELLVETAYSLDDISWVIESVEIDSEISHESVGAPALRLYGGPISRSTEYILVSKFYNDGNDPSAPYGPDGEVYIELDFVNGEPSYGEIPGYYTNTQNSSIGFYFNDERVLYSKSSKSSIISKPRIRVNRDEDVVLRYAIYAERGSGIDIQPTLKYAS